MTEIVPSCCAAARADAPARQAVQPATRVGELFSSSVAAALPSPTEQIIARPGGEFLMGREDADVNAGDGESPVRMQRVEPFGIAALTVTNSRFAKFVAATGYVTEAEKFG